MRQNRINPFNLFNGAFTPNWILRRKQLSQGAKLCYGVLCWFAGRNGYCWPSQRKISGRMGVTDRQVRTYITELEKCLLIEVEQRGLTRSSLYYFLDHPWIWETAPADEDEQERVPAGGPDRKDTAGQDWKDPSDRRESREESQSSLRSDEEETPSARNLNSSGEKMAAWKDFLTDLSSTFGEGILSPVGSSRAYIRTCVLNPDWPPINVDLDLLRDVARAVKAGMWSGGLRTVRLPLIEDMEDTATWFGKLRAAKGEDFLPWLQWASAQVERKGSLADDKLLLHALTQAGALKSFSEWEAERVGVH